MVALSTSTRGRGGHEPLPRILISHKSTTSYQITPSGSIITYGSHTRPDCAQTLGRYLILTDCLRQVLLNSNLCGPSTFINPHPVASNFLREEPGIENKDPQLGGDQTNSHLELICVMGKEEGLVGSLPELAANWESLTSFELLFTLIQSDRCAHCQLMSTLELANPNFKAFTFDWCSAK